MTLDHSARLLEYVFAGSRAEYYDFVHQAKLDDPSIRFTYIPSAAQGISMPRVPRDVTVHIIGTAYFRKDFIKEFRNMVYYTNNIVDHTLSRYGIVYVPTAGLAYELAKRLGISEERQPLGQKSISGGVSASSSIMRPKDEL